MASSSSVVESCLFACPSGAYVYQLPAGQSSSLGHRAEMWDVDNWLCEVRVRVVERTDECFVLLETSAASVSPESAGTNDRGQGEDSYSLFAACPIPADGPLSVAVDAVVDSSRYFVLRVEDISEAATPKERRKHAFIGVGFRERTSALDFMAALQTFRARHKRALEAEAMAAQFAAREESAAQAGMEADASLFHGFAEGETITISLKSGRGAAKKAPTTTALSAPPPLLPPPPTKKAASSSPPPPPPVHADDDDDEWGDFQ